PQARDIASLETTRHTAHLIARITRLNSKKADGFLLALTGERAGLAGLPLAMGDACPTRGERSRPFSLAVPSVRPALRGPQARAASSSGPATGTNGLAGGRPVQQVAATSPAVPVAVSNDLGIDSDTFWEGYRNLCGQEDKTLARVDQDRREHVTAARVAALMQVLAPEIASVRRGLVEYLAGVSHVHATKALARLPIF